MTFIKKHLYTRTCRRCEDRYTTPGKFSKICPNCSLSGTNQKWRKEKEIKRIEEQIVLLKKELRWLKK